MPPFFLIVLFLNLYTGLHGFLFFRALLLKIHHLKNIRDAKHTALAGLPFLFYWIIFFLITAVYAGITFERGFRSAFGFINSYWGMTVFVPPLAALDLVYLVRFILRLILTAAKKIPNEQAAGFWGWDFTFAAHIAVIILAFLFIFYGSWRARSPVITEYNIKTEKPVPGGKLEAVMVSDIHIGAMVRKKELVRMVKEINALDGDIILIAGDILDRELAVWDAENMSEEFSLLEAEFGVWAVSGNHDNYGGRIADLSERLEVCGIRLLEDNAEEINGFSLIGRKDRSSGRFSGPRKSIAELIEGLDRNSFVILMDHQPLDLREAEAAGVDLQLSGHTHHGQIWPGMIFTRRIYENDYGLLYKGKSAFVVSSGYGTWGPSLRVGTYPEIVRITISN